MIGCIGHDGDCCKDREEIYRDAARYRWLRSNPTWIGYDADFRPDQIDAVIDAERKEQGYDDTREATEAPC